MILGGGGLLTEIGLVAKGLSSALAGVAWLLFVSEYTGDSEWIPTWFSWAITAEAALFGLLLAVNPGNLVVTEIAVDQIGLFAFPIESAGVITELQLLVSGGLVVGSLVLLGRFFMRTQTVYRYQALIIFVTGVVVVISTTLFITESQIHPFVDPTPILFNLQALAVGWALYRYDFLKVAPVVVTRFFRDMNDPVLIVDSELAVADYNTAAETLVSGMAKQVPVAALDDEEFSEMLIAAVDGTGDDVEFTTLRTDGGQQRTYDIELTEVTDQFDIAQGYVVVLRDITDRKQRERRLKEQNERLEEFTDIVSHDLRNPLAAARGWTTVVDDQLADDSVGSEAPRAQLKRVTDAHQRMDELIDVLLTMARQGQTVDETEPVSLEQCAKEAWSTAATDGMALVIETGQTVMADPARLRQALENLFRNANDHGSATTVTIEETPSGFVIEDDGTGIPADDRDSLFEFGYTTDDDGTGIGLAVVKRIVEAHGWQITVDKSDSGGTRFEITGVSTSQ
jgi:PAS domain S-box-containing protein